MITVVIPVLGRPQNAQPVVDSIRSSSESVDEIVFVMSPNDEEEWAACEATGERSIVVPWDAGPGDFARKINAGFDLSARWFSEFVFLGADDLRFHPGWDSEALSVALTGASVVGTNDLGNPMVRRGKHATHSLVRRSYVDEFGLTWDGKPGLVYSDAYDHQYVDTELVSVAIERGVFSFAERSHVEHLHPLWNKGVMDATYTKGMAEGMADRRLFEKRRRELAGRDVAPWGGDAA